MSGVPVETSLRQMIAVLEDERQALAGLDLGALVLASRDKLELCDRLEAGSPVTLDEATRDLAETARRMNEVNRRVRNLLAANVAARLDALSGGAVTYRMAQAAAR
jgi:hypothetical protein